MKLTTRGAYVLVALSFLMLFACLVIGQELKADRLEAETVATP